MSLRVGSLCSGYGGLDLAVEAHYGATPAWFCEFDAAPSRVLAQHWPDVPNYGDVWHTEWSAVEPVDILTAGFPCQPFSHAGKRKGADDPRHLWPGIVTAIGALRPRLCVFENVRGLLSLGMGDVLGDLAGLGYDARWGVVRAADAGAPHGRARIFITATDTRGGSLARPAVSDDGLRLAAERGRLAPADACGERHGGGVHAGDVGRVDGPDAGEARQRERSRSVAGDRGAAAAADAPGGRRCNRGESGMAPEPHAESLRRPPEDCRDGTDGVIEWGAYGPAVARWESGSSRSRRRWRCDSSTTSGGPPHDLSTRDVSPQRSDDDVSQRLPVRLSLRLRGAPQVVGDAHVPQRRGHVRRP